MSVTFDVLVIGGGIAGFAAALAASKRGAKTGLVHSAPGASALMSGAWSGPLRDEVKQALEGAGYILSATSSPLPHERGRTILAEYAGASHARAVLTDDVTVCGFAGLPGFHARVLAQAWRPAAPLPHTTIVLAATPAAGWSAASLAAFIERKPAAIAQTGVRGKCIFPAVLGIDDGAAVMRALADQGIEASEALAASPSLPGWRLHAALNRALRSAGVSVLEGRAVADRTEGARVHAVRVNGDVVQATSFVLATGKFTAGGLSATHEFREHVFDLPVWLEHLGDIFTAPDPLPLTDPVRTEDQPLLLAGVHADDASRAIDRTGRPVYENVFVAGTIRADWSASHSGLGHCAEDGWTAGMSASA